MGRLLTVAMLMAGMVPALYAETPSASLAQFAARISEQVKESPPRERRDLYNLLRALDELQAGHPINTPLRNGYTVLQQTVRVGEEELAHFLIAQGANAQMKAPGNCSMLMLAARSGNLSLFHYFRMHMRPGDAGVDANGTSLLQHACAGGNANIVAEALHMGGKIAATDKRGHNCLIYAAMSGEEKLFYELLSRCRGGCPVGRDKFDLLMAAARGASTQMVRTALAMGYSARAADTGGNTALMEAARSGNVEILHLLLRAGADLKSRDRHGATAAMYAAAAGNREAFHLLEGHADDAPDKYGRTVLVYAATGGDEELVRELLKDGARPEVLNDLPLRTAVSYGYTRMALELAAAGMSAFRSELHSIPLRSHEEVMYFCRFVIDHTRSESEAASAASLYRILLEAERDKTLLSRPDDGPMGYTPMQHTVAAGFDGVFEYMLAAGVDLDARSRHDYTALMLAVELGRFDYASRLLSAGADPNILNQHGMTAIKYAASNGRTDIFNLLLRSGADPNLHSAHGPSTISCAISAGEDGLEMVRILSERVPMPTSQNAAYQLLCQCIRDNNHLLFERILKRWPDANAADEHGVTLVMVAAGAECDDSMLKMLIDRGGDVNAVDHRARMPLQYAASPGKRQLLLRAGAIP